MIRSLAILVLTASAVGAAPAFGGEERNTEFRFTPYVGHSSYDGVLFGGDYSVAVDLSDRWQWKFGIDAFGFSKSKSRNAMSGYTGAVYNFSDDRPRSYFIGASVGYGNRNKDFWTEDNSDNRFYASVEAGKRFKLNDSGSWAWMPTVQLDSAGVGGALLSVRPLNFAYSF